MYQSYSELEKTITILESLIETYQKESANIDKYICLQQNRLEELKQEKTKLTKEFSETEGKLNKVFYYRIIKGLTQEKTAEKLGMSTRQIQRIEKNIKKLSSDVVMSC
jgi:plasmid maintenance system antidote protein VapI